MTSEGIFSKAICSQHFPYTLFVASARDFCEFWFESSPDRNCPFRGTASLFPSGSPAVLTQVTAEDTGRGLGPALAAHAAHGAGKLHLSSHKPRGAPPGTHSSCLCPSGRVSATGMPTSFSLFSLVKQHRAKMGGKGDLGQWMEEKIAKVTYAENSHIFTLLCENFAFGKVKRSSPGALLPWLPLCSSLICTKVDFISLYLHMCVYHI